VSGKIKALDVELFVNGGNSKDVSDRVRQYLSFHQSSQVLKLINNASSLNKGNHDRDGVWISDLN